MYVAIAICYWDYLAMYLYVTNLQVAIASQWIIVIHCDNKE